MIPQTRLHTVGTRLALAGVILLVLRVVIGTVMLSGLFSFLPTEFELMYPAGGGLSFLVRDALAGLTDPLLLGLCIAAGLTMRALGAPEKTPREPHHHMPSRTHGVPRERADHASARSSASTIE